jgi:hypothetical protein
MKLAIAQIPESESSDRCTYSDRAINEAKININEIEFNPTV